MLKAAERLGVLIVEYRDAAGALRLAQTLGGDPCVEIVIISTGPAPCAQPSQAIRVLHLPSNPGFGAAANRGCEALSDSVTHLLLCNTDICLSLEDVRNLWRHAQATGWAQLSPMILSPSGVVEWDGGHLDFRRIQVVHDGLGDPPRLGADVRRTEFVTAACMLVRRDAWNDVGGMREDFFLYGEDADFSMRLGRAGLTGGVVTSTRVVHAVSGSVGRDSPVQLYLMTRNGIRLFREWSPHLWGRIACWIMLPLRLSWGLLRRRGSPRALLWILRGIVDARPKSRYHRSQGRAALMLGT